MMTLSVSDLGPLGDKVQALAEAATAADWAVRTAQGLPTQHCLDIASFPFGFAPAEVAAFAAAAAEWAQTVPTTWLAQMHLGYARLAQADVQAANAAFARAAEIDRTSLAAILQLGQVEPRTTQLPPVQGKWPEKACLFVACDLFYLRSFIYPLLSSLNDFAPDQRVHIHLMGPETDLKAVIRQLPNARISATQENPEEFIHSNGIQPQAYYGAARLVRFAEALQVNSGPLWMCDADALFHKSPKSLFPISGDIALRVRPGRIEPWHQFSACLIMGRPRGREYFTRVADIVANNLEHAFWGLDQFALFSAWLSLREKTALTLLGPSQADVEWRDDGILWFTGGIRKNRLFTSPRPTDPSRFELLFWKYWPGTNKP